MNKKNLITLALVVAFIAVIVLATTEDRYHPPKEQWLKKHATTVTRNKNSDEFCLGCHNEKFGHTKENFCNDCHKASNVKPIE